MSPYRWSQYEMELFQNEAACQTPLDRQYHTEVKALNKAKGRRNNRIFTYTDHDRYTNSLPFQQLVRYPHEDSLWVNSEHHIWPAHISGESVKCRLEGVKDSKCICKSKCKTTNSTILVCNCFIKELVVFWSLKQNSSELLTTTKSVPTYLAERMANVRHRRQDRRTM